MDARADLIIRFMSGMYGFCHKDAELIADYILDDRKRIVKPLVEFSKLGGSAWDAIEETLENAGMEL